MYLLDVKDLIVGYGKKAVAGPVNFQIDTGDYICVVGENGAGKSTLMKTLLSLISPLGGVVIFSNGLKRNEIGYLPQQSDIQKDFPATVREIVLSGCQNLKKRKLFYSREDKLVAARNMELMGISDLANKSYRKLSGGQQRRTLLARALCATKKLLFLDEPVSGLDPQSMAEMYDLTGKLNSQGIALVTISHDITNAIGYANKILHIGEKCYIENKSR